MEFRKYITADCARLADLFFETVHTVNAKDYSKEQLCVWANGNVDIAAWDRSFLAHNTIIAEENGIIVGFGDMDDSGYLDRLYVHKEYQGNGIASSIIRKLEQAVKLKGVLIFSTHASITAKPFFEKHGYTVVRQNIVTRNNVELINFIMKKQIAK